MKTPSFSPGNPLGIVTCTAASFSVQLRWELWPLSLKRQGFTASHVSVHFGGKQLETTKGLEQGQPAAGAAPKLFRTDSGVTRIWSPLSQKAPSQLEVDA